MFAQGSVEYELVNKGSLVSGFKLLTKDTGINLDAILEEMVRIDIKNQEDTPVTSRLTRSQQQQIRKHFMGLDNEGKRRDATWQIFQMVNNSSNKIPEKDLKEYIQRIVDGFSSEDMLFYYENSYMVSKQISDKIKHLLDNHRVDMFDTYLETELISVRDSYALPESIPIKETNSYRISKSLYEDEGKMNSLELKMARNLASLDNVRWWHRNDTYNGFYINGPINHYPDFIVMTNRNHLVMVETKGTQLKNNDGSKQKLKLGKQWADRAGTKYRYYMVFDEGDIPMDGAYEMSKFLEILQQL